MKPYDYSTQKDYAVVLVDEDDKPVDAFLPMASTWSFNQLSSFYKVVVDPAGKLFDRVMVPKEHAKWMVRRRIAPLACAFHASKGVLKNMHGVELSHEDEEWFLGHGLLEPGGLPLPHTLRVVQGLIAPYGFRISRVRVKPGLTLKGNLREWRALLGMNPAALQDLGTTNEQYAEQTGQPLAEVNALFRMEYHDTPLAGGVVCEASGDSEHGHASYAAPRRKPTGNEYLSFQFSRRDYDPWPVAEPEWPYVEAEYERTLDVYGIIRAQEDARKAQMLELNARVKPAEGGEQTGMKLIARVNAGICRVCGQHEVAKGDLMCSGCWTAVWDGYRCPNKTCDTEFFGLPPMQGDFARGELTAVCQKCTTLVALSAKSDDGAETVIRGLKGKLSEVERERWRAFAFPYDKTT